MYEENENKIEWAPILKKVGMVVVVLLVIFGIVTLVSKCTNSKDEEKPNNTKEISLEAQLDELEKATLEYLTIDNLPTELNASKTIRLKILINRNLTEGIKDEENNQCDTSESYSEVTRLEHNYAVKMSLTCGKNKASRVIYVGCFESCDGGLCAGMENQTGGICSAVDTQNPGNDEDDSDDTNNGVVQPNIKDSSSQTSTSTNNGVVKPNTSTSTSTTPSTNGGSSNNTTINNNITLPAMYEFRRCETKPIHCNVGTLNTSTGWCEFYTSKLDYGIVVPTNKTTTSTYTEAANVPKTTTTEVTLLPSQAKNTATVTYRFKAMATDGKITYYKTVTTYGCRDNVQPINGICTYTSTNTVSGFECEDKTYNYNANNNTCTKWIDILDHAVPGDEQVCETTWNYSTSLPGWQSTGRVR